VYNGAQWFAQNNCAGVKHVLLAEITQDSYLDSSAFVKTYTDWHRTKLYGKDGVDTYVYSNAACKVLSFRGTVSSWNSVERDLDFFGSEDWNTHACSGNSGKTIKVYPGPSKYVKSFAATQSGLAGNNYDYIVGHSLGGSSAILFSLKYVPPLKSTVTFACMATRSGSAKNTLPFSVRYAHEDDPAGGDGGGLCYVPTLNYLCTANNGGPWSHFNLDTQELRAVCKPQSVWKDTWKSTQCRNRKPNTGSKLNKSSADWNWHDSGKYVNAVKALWADAI
jgi:hypothetical protein